jgi:hypothetical protein
MSRWGAGWLLLPLLLLLLWLLRFVFQLRDMLPGAVLNAMSRWGAGWLLLLLW